MFSAASRYAVTELAKPADRTTAKNRHCCHLESTGFSALTDPYMTISRQPISLI